MGRLGAVAVISVIGLGVAIAGCAAAPPPAPSASPVAGSAVVASRGDPGCSTGTSSAPALPASATAMTGLGPRSSPFGVVISRDGHWAFAAVTELSGAPAGELAVLRLSAGQSPRLVRTIAVAQAIAGAAVTPDGRFLLLAGGQASVIVVDIAAAEQGSKHAVIGTLTAPAPASGAIEVAVSADGSYAFVSMEQSGQIAVFNLEHALASGFGPGAYVGAIPTQVAPVGLAVSPDGHWLYSTSEDERPGSSQVGTLSVISVAAAESDPAHSVIARVTAGCNPVRVITSADGSVVWVAARASNALLAFSAAGLRTYPSRALLADVQVGEAPVGMALARNGSLIVVADSDRFASAGKSANLAVVDVTNALSGKPALLGYLPAGGFPRDVAAALSGDTVLVANYLSDQVESVNVGALP